MKHRLAGRRQFAAVRAARHSAASGALRVHVAPNGCDGARFGFVIPKSVGGAVVRNRVRRRVRAALEPQRSGLAGFDVIVVAGLPAAAQPFSELCVDLVRCLGRALASARTRPQRAGDDAGAARLAENERSHPGPPRAAVPTSA